MTGARTSAAADPWGTSAAGVAARADRPAGGSLRLVEWIWTVKGSVALAPGRSAADVLGGLAPLFDQPGTTYETAGDTLTFRKKDQPAQDKMSVFDSGALRVEAGATGPVLRYSLVSRTLLFCFLLPLLFLGFAGLTLAIDHARSPAAGTAKAAKPAVKKTPDVPMNPIDKALGAPVPEKKKDGKDKDDDKKLTPTAAYVFAGIFAVLYLVGRLLEAKMANALFRRTATGA